MKEDILTQIIDSKRKTINLQMEYITMKMLERIVSIIKSKKKLSLSRSIMSSPTGIISEFKRRSPSKGWINRKADIKQITREYAKAGAAGLSVLTDRDFFESLQTEISLEAKKEISSKPAMQLQPPLF